MAYAIVLASCILFASAQPCGFPETYGSDHVGQAGHNAGRVVWTPGQPNYFYEEYPATCMTSASAGSTHTVMTNGSIIYVMGSNSWGQLCQPNDQIGTGSPYPILVDAYFPNNNNITAVAAGTDFSLFLTGAGEIWACGTNQRAELGLKRSTLEEAQAANTSIWWSTTPLQTGVPGFVVGMAAGDHHSLAVTSGGEVYAWGANDDGQLADGSVQTQYTPILVWPPQNISMNGTLIAFFGTIPYWNDTVVPVDPFAIAVFAGHCNSFVITNSTAYAAGCNEHGQLGTGIDIAEYYLWGTVLAPEGVVFAQIAANLYETCAISTAKQAFCWGDNMRGFLGMGFGDLSIYTAQPVLVNFTDAPSTFDAISATMETFQLFSNETNQVYTWGNNWIGGFGVGIPASPINNILYAPQPAPLLNNVYGIAATCGASGHMIVMRHSPPSNSPSETPSISTTESFTPTPSPSETHSITPSITPSPSPDVVSCGVSTHILWYDQSAEFSCTITIPLGTTVTCSVSYAGTAVRGTDYTTFPTPGTVVTIPAGSTSGSVNITQIGSRDVLCVIYLLFCSSTVDIVGVMNWDINMYAVEPSATPSRSPSKSPTNSPTSSSTATVSASQTKSQTPSTTNSKSPSKTPSISKSPSKSQSPSKS